MEANAEIHRDEKLKTLVRELALEDYQPPSAPSFASQDKYVRLRKAGSRLWLDTGDAGAAEKVWSAELEALTTNNTLVNQVVQTGALDGVITQAARKIREAVPGISDRELIVELGFLANAKLALGLVSRFGAKVSVELHPDVGYDIDRTLAFARRYREINPEWFYVKVPLTPDGFVAVRRLSAEGIPVNFTLGFSARQNYLATRFSNPAFVNVFLGRLNSVVEENHIGKPDNVGEKATLASDEMVQNIRVSGAAGTQQIAASIRSGAQVAALAGVDVLTIPPKAAAQYLEMPLAAEDVQPQDWRDLQVEVDDERFQKLWQIDEQFIGFVDDVVKRADAVQTGADLVELSVKHGVGLFHNWSPEERQRIREKGKIPDLSQWPDVPIDDLMSLSALEAFVVDQMALDQRIAGMV